MLPLRTVGPGHHSRQLKLLGPAATGPECVSQRNPGCKPTAKQTVRWRRGANRLCARWCGTRLSTTHTARRENTVSELPVPLRGRGGPLCRSFPVRQSSAGRRPCGRRPWCVASVAGSSAVRPGRAARRGSRVVAMGLWWAALRGRRPCGRRPLGRLGFKIPGLIVGRSAAPLGLRPPWGRSRAPPPPSALSRGFGRPGELLLLGGPGVPACCLVLPSVLPAPPGFASRPPRRRNAAPPWGRRPASGRFPLPVARSYPESIIGGDPLASGL